MKTKKDHSNSTTRREFIFGAAKMVGTVTLVAKMLPLSALAFNEEEESPQETEDKGEFVRIKSGKANYFASPAHVHTFDIPMKDICYPPEQGGKYQSTTAPYPFKHHHTLKLSQLDLMEIARGREVTIHDTVRDHAWMVLIKPVVGGKCPL